MKNGIHYAHTDELLQMKVYSNTNSTFSKREFPKLLSNLAYIKTIYSQIFVKRFVEFDVIQKLLPIGDFRYCNGMVHAL